MLHASKPKNPNTKQKQYCKKCDEGFKNGLHQNNNFFLRGGRKMQNSHTRSSVSVKLCCLSLSLSLPLSCSFSLQNSGSRLEKKITNRFYCFSTFLVFPGQLCLPADCFNSDGDTATSCEQLNINTSLTSILSFPP